MDKMDYFKLSLKNKYPIKLEWVYSVLTKIKTDSYKNKFIKIENNKFTALLEEEIVIDGYNSNKALYRLVEEITLTNNDMLCIDKPVKTTIGLALVNYVLIEYPFKGKIKYINEGFDIGDLVGSVGTYLSTEKIEVSEYKTFVDACTFMEGYSRVATASATEKNMLPPKGLITFKKDLIKTFEKKYGPDWNKDSAIIVEYEKQLKDFYNKWIEDDPTNNKLVGGKVKNNAMLKKYLTFGVATGFDGIEDTPTQINDSLLDGYPEDPEQLAKMFNTSRSASYDRGFETQKGGGTAKDVLRATSSIKITKNDCGVKYGKYIVVTDSNKKDLIDRYIILNGKSVMLKSAEEVDKYLGREIVIRSPLYCKEKDSNFCSICAGNKLAKYPTGISLIVTDISESILTASLKKMHNSTISTVELNMSDVIS